LVLSLAVTAWICQMNPTVFAAAPKTQSRVSSSKAAKKPGAVQPQSSAKTKGVKGPSPTAQPKVDTSRRETEIYGARLDGLQKDVDGLKDRIFRSKARLSLLKETVLHGVLAGSRVIVAHRNVMGSQFRLVKVAVTLDGAQIYARNDTSEIGGSLDREDELVVFDGNLVPGPHSLTVDLTYRGHGYGMFSYLNNYTFDSRSSHSFIAPENGAVRVLSVGFEEGNLTTEMKDRPSIDWQEIPLDATGKPKPRAGKRRKQRTQSQPKGNRPTGATTKLKATQTKASTKSAVVQTQSSKSSNDK